MGFLVSGLGRDGCGDKPAGRPTLDLNSINPDATSLMKLQSFIGFRCNRLQCGLYQSHALTAAIRMVCQKMYMYHLLDFIFCLYRETRESKRSTPPINLLYVSKMLGRFTMMNCFAFLSHLRTSPIGFKPTYDDTTSTDLLSNHLNAIMLQDVSTLKSTDPLPSFFNSFSDLRIQPFSLLDLTVPTYQSDLSCKAFN